MVMPSPPASLIMRISGSSTESYTTTAAAPAACALRTFWSNEHSFPSAAGCSTDTGGTDGPSPSISRLRWPSLIRRACFQAR